MKITFEFYVSTRYVGSKVSDKVEIEFEDDATEKQIEALVEECWIDWRNEQCDGGWERVAD